MISEHERTKLVERDGKLLKDLLAVGHAQVNALAKAPDKMMRLHMNRSTADT